MRKLAAFLYHWLVVGFFCGTATLIGPVHWVTAYGRARAWDDGFESGVVRGVILLFIVGSALLAWGLARTALYARTRHVRWGVPALATLCACGALALWLSPEQMTAGLTAETRVGATFTFGPAPDQVLRSRSRTPGQACSRRRHRCNRGRERTIR